MQFIWRTLSSLVSEDGVQQSRQEGFLRIKVLVRSRVKLRQRGRLKEQLWRRRLNTRSSTAPFRCQLTRLSTLSCCIWWLSWNMGEDLVAFVWQKVSMLITPVILQNCWHHLQWALNWNNASHKTDWFSQEVISLVYSVFFFKQKKTGGRELQNLTKHQQGLSSFQLRNYSCDRRTRRTSEDMNI